MILLLDYDNTISPASSPALTEMNERITQFIRERFPFNGDADQLRKQYNRQFGSTLGGLLHYFDLDPHEYFDFIHQVSRHSLPPLNPTLREWFRTLSCPLYLFTNARKDWVTMGLHSMGIEDPPFEMIFDIEYLEWKGKPHPAAYEKVERYLRRNHSGPLNVIFADDHPTNLQAAKERRWKTVWVTPHHHETQKLMRQYSFDAHCPALSEFPCPVP